MKFCRCDMCEAVADLPMMASQYGGEPLAPRGWTYVRIARERTVQPPAPQRMRLQVETADGAVNELTAMQETDERPAGYSVHVATELQLCPKCLERLVGPHPSLSKRIAQDDTRAERNTVPVPMS